MSNLMRKAAIALCGALPAAALTFLALNNPLWTDKDGALAAAQAWQFSNVEVTGYGWFDCPGLQLFSTRIAGSDAEGKRVEAVVCRAIDQTIPTVKLLHAPWKPAPPMAG